MASDYGINKVESSQSRRQAKPCNVIGWKLWPPSFLDVEKERRISQSNKDKKDIHSY